MQKFLCRIDDETIAILEFLHRRSQATVALSDRGRHLLRDASERAREALQLAQKVRERAVNDSPPDPNSPGRVDDLLRLSHLCLEVDRKVDDAARELAAFDAALVGFALSPFRLEALTDVVERLERYVEDYVAEATTRARALHQTARKLLRPSFDTVFADSREEVQLRMRNDPFFAGSPGVVREAQQIMRELVPFFASGGRFEKLLERVHRSARDVVRRVHKHIENIRSRNIRIETVRDRSRDMAHLMEDDISAANMWINELFASAHLVSDLRLGTPAERSAPPRPVRRYEARRAMHRGQFLPDKQGTPGQSKALERLRLLQIDQFVERKILQGGGRVTLDTAALSQVQDFRSLLEAVKVHELRAGRARKLLSYAIARPVSNGSLTSRARFDLPEGLLDAPNLIFTRTGAHDEE